MSPSELHIGDEVAEALRDGGAVVALESTVIAHGLPWPDNLEVACRLEAAVRGRGAVPATIGVLDGVPTVGLDQEGLERMARADSVAKLSTRELGLAMARRLDGATTVASTAHLAHLAGIRVFATGGIGGVHRGAPLDVSADLEQLARSPIVCVAAGAKSILDLPATREALESLNILVLGWQTDELPAFYSPTSGLTVDARVEEASEVAAIARAGWKIQLPAAILLAVPVPADHGIDAETADAAIARALAAADRDGIGGKQITPFLLRHLNQATGGATLAANTALLLQNAEIAASVAMELSRA